MNLKTWLGFLSGAVFVLGLVVTCGNAGKRADTGAGTEGGMNVATVASLDTGIVHAGGGTKWEYAYYGPRGIEVPATAATPNIASSDSTVSVLNAMGADGWELVGVNPSTNGYYFKRPK